MRCPYFRPGGGEDMENRITSAALRRTWTVCTSGLEKELFIIV